MKNFIKIYGKQRMGVGSSISYHHHPQSQLAQRNRIYIFNLPEGATRLYYSILGFQNINLIRGIFLSSLSRESCQGIPGFLLTSIEKTQQQSRIGTLHGPLGLRSLLNSWTQFFRTKKRSRNHPQLFEYGQHTAHTEDDLEIIPVQLVSEISGSLYYSFIIKSSVKTFKREELNKYGLSRFAPELYRIMNGERVMSSEGEVIEIEDLLEEICTQVTILLYVPGKEYLRSLLSHPELREYIYKNREHVEDKLDVKRRTEISLIHHVSPIEVLTDPLYTQFIRSLGEVIKHNFDCPQVNEGFFGSSNYTSIQLAHRLATVNKHIFTTYQKDRDVNIIDIGSRYIDEVRGIYKADSVHFKGLGGTIPLERLCSDVLHSNDDDLESRIRKEIGEDRLLESRLREHLSHSAPKFKDIYEKYNNLGSRDKEELNIYINEPNITFLGTGSTHPTLSRNVSSILFAFPRLECNKGSTPYMLMDCGEGTYLQLIDHFGIEQTNNILSNLKVIAITHSHADHHLGLSSILQHVTQQHNTQIYLIIPDTLHHHYLGQWLSHSQLQSLNIIYTNQLDPQTSQQKMNYQYGTENNNYFPTLTQHIVNANIANLQTKISQTPQLNQFKTFCLAQLGITNFFTVKTLHNIDSFAFVFSGGNWKIVYTGDGYPSINLNYYCKNPTLLITECTLKNDKSTQAKNKRHTYPLLANKISKEINAERTILTHLAAEARIIMPLNEKEIRDAFEAKIFFAFDHLQFDLRHIEWMYKLMPVFHYIF